MIRPGRLLLLTTSMGRGGAEQVVEDLAIGFRGRNWSVVVVSMMTMPGEHLPALERGGVEARSLEMRRGRASLGALLRYRSELLRWKPDIVHSHMVHANLLARIGRLFVPGIPVVCTVHSLVEAREGSGETVESRLREVAYRATDRLASATTAVSAAAAARYIEVRAVPQNRMIHIPNGFDFSRATPRGHARAAIRRELGIRDDEFLWTTVGRLVAEKGHSSLLEAFDRIRKGRPDVRLVIVGDGPEKAALERLSSELRLGGDALLLGMRTDVASILDAADAFVLSSEVEGLPMVLLEAAAQRLPIVSTDVGGCREVARPELGAILVTPGPEGLARGMMAVMEMTDPERASIGEALRRHVQSEYDQGAILQRWEQVYASVAPSLDGA